MHINLGSLDPASPLAQRIHAALAKETGRADSTLRSGADFESSRNPHSWPSRSRSGVKSGRTGEFRSEYELQVAIVGMIAAEAMPDVICFHVPNGGRRGKAEAGRLKGMGTLAGIPDLIILANGCAHGLEIKTDKGRLSGSQKRMVDRFSRAAVPYEIARSVTAARMILKRWGVLTCPATYPEVTARRKPTRWGCRRWMPLCCGGSVWRSLAITTFNQTERTHEKQSSAIAGRNVDANEPAGPEAV